MAEVDAVPTFGAELKVGGLFSQSLVSPLFACQLRGISSERTRPIPPADSPSL